MWLFCTSGFFSAVVDRDDPERVLVRSRFSGDITRLFGGRYPETRTPAADYPFRAFVPRAEWETAVLAQAEDMDYGNFKSAAHDGTRRDAAYMAVWDALRRHSR